MAGREDTTRLISQNGVKYRTICSKCNSMIGSEYDPVLNDFHKTVSSFLLSNLSLPPVTYIKTKPMRLFKAVLAHFLSAKLNIDDVVMDSKIREIVTSKDAAIPDGINVFYWIYPYDCTIIVRDFSVPIVPGGFSETTFCSLIKYFPIAFLISDTERFRGVDSLGKFRNLGIDDERDIRIDLSLVRDYDFPEKVDSSNVVFMSAESQHGIFATPR